MIIVTVEGGFVQEVYSDNPDELVLVRDFDNGEDSENPEHQVSKALDLKACDPAVWPDVDIADYRAQESGAEDLPEDVELISSGYEWECPACMHLNNEPMPVNEVVCANCSRKFNVGGYNHPEQETVGG